MDIKKIIVAAVLILLVFTPFGITFADTIDCSQCQGLVPCGCDAACPCTICHFFGLINRIIKLVITVFVPIVAGLVVVIAGIMMIINRDKSDVLSKAKEIILMTIIGLVLIYGAYGLVFTIFAGMGYVHPDRILNFELKCN